MPKSTFELPNDLLTELRDKAAAEKKSVDELAADAFRQYFEGQNWERLLASRRQAAKAKGLTETDVPRLIDEVRRERRRTG